MDRRLRANLEKKNKEVYRPSRATRLFSTWRKLKKTKLAVAGFGIVLFMSMIALLAPVIAPYDPAWKGIARSPPSMKHFFGTDSLGRDMLSLVIYGGRISLFVGLSAVFIEVIIGVGIGMIAGYFGGKVDEILMRVTDVVLTLPTLMMLIVAVSMFAARGVHVLILVMGFLGWPWMCRYVRSEFLTLKEKTYVEATRSMGATGWRIMIRHILPNALSTVIVVATMDIPWYILFEATLTFLGFGDPGSSSWGVLLQRGKISMQTGWWMITFPGLALLFTSLGFNLFGDGLRDALDVTLRD